MQILNCQNIEFHGEKCALQNAKTHILHNLIRINSIFSVHTQHTYNARQTRMCFFLLPESNSIQQQSHNISEMASTVSHNMKIYKTVSWFRTPPYINIIRIYSVYLCDMVGLKHCSSTLLSNYGVIKLYFVTIILGESKRRQVFVYLYVVLCVRTHAQLAHISSALKHIWLNMCIHVSPRLYSSAIRTR